MQTVTRMINYVHQSLNQPIIGIGTGVLLSIPVTLIAKRIFCSDSPPYRPNSLLQQQRTLNSSSLNQTPLQRIQEPPLNQIPLQRIQEPPLNQIPLPLPIFSCPLPNDDDVLMAALDLLSPDSISPQIFRQQQQQQHNRLDLIRRLTVESMLKNEAGEVIAVILPSSGICMGHFGFVQNYTSVAWGDNKTILANGSKLMTFDPSHKFICIEDLGDEKYNCYILTQLKIVIKISLNKGKEVSSTRNLDDESAKVLAHILYPAAQERAKQI